MSPNPKRKFELEQAQVNVDELGKQASKSIKIRDAMLDEIEALEVNKIGITVEIGYLTERRDELDLQVQDDNKKLTLLETQLIDLATEIRDYRGRITDLLAQIRELDDARQRAIDDIVVLDEEISNQEIKSTELEASFKARKAVLDKQLTDTQRRLQNTLDSLVEAQRNDKAFRKAWAEQHLKLEQRMKVVQVAEGRVSDAESRITELNNYSKL